MAISTINGALAGMQVPCYFSKIAGGTTVAGRPVSYYQAGGSQGVGTYNTSLNGGTYSSSSAVPVGIFYRTDPPSGNSYLGRLEVCAAQAGTILLVDRLWDNGGITITSNTSQSITSPTWPARDITGTTNGVGVLLAVEVSASTGAGTPTITVGYTNSGGTSGRTGTNIIATVATAPPGTFYQISLQASDLGVQSVQSLTLSATWTSGTINLVAYRLLAALEIPGVGVIPNAIDSLTSGFPQLFNGTCPYLVFVPCSTSSTNLIGTYIETQG